MEPVTHILTGTCLARAGFNRKAAYATLAMAIAAEFPDIDMLWGLRGPVAEFRHHRGITHTFLGVPFEAAFLLLCFMTFHWLRLRTAEGRAPIGYSNSRSGSKAPVRWGTLYLLLLLALLSHLLLDYTNSYGIRPFFPFDDRWFAGSIVFIFDPAIFVVLVAGLLLPLLFGMIGREVGSRRERYRGRGWAVAALVGVFALWSVRWVEHGKAVALAQNETLRAPATSQTLAPAASASPAPQEGSDDASVRPLLTALRSFASPDPLSLFRWYTATDFGPVVRIGTADTDSGELAEGAIFAPPPRSADLVGAEGSPLGRAYLDWSPLPILQASPGASARLGLPTAESRLATTVTFLDPRFMGDVPLLNRADHPPLEGQVVIGPRGQVLAEGMDGRFGR